MDETLIWESDNGKWRIEMDEGKYWIVIREKGNRKTALTTLYPFMRHMPHDSFFPPDVREAMTKYCPR